MKNKFSRALVTAGMVVAAAVGTLAPAQAETAPTEAPSGSITVGLSVHHFDMALANEHGYKIVEVDGKQTSVKVSDGPIKQDAVEPYIGTFDRGMPVVHGACGSSWLYYAAKGNRRADVYTGFDVWPAPAVTYTWRVNVFDLAGVGEREWGGVVNNWDWGAYWETYHSTTGSSSAKVVYGVAFLANGAVCYSGNPWQYTTLY